MPSNYHSLMCSYDIKATVSITGEKVTVIQTISLAVVLNCKLYNGGYIATKIIERGSTKLLLTTAAGIAICPRV